MRNQSLPQKGRTHKYSLMLLSFLVVAFMLIPNVSAAEFDNVKNYNEELRVVTITNAFGLGEVIGQARLVSDNNVKVAQGYQKVAQFDIWAYNDYNDAIKQFTFTDMKKKEKINREFDLKILSYENVEVDDFEDNCTMLLNQTISCNSVKVGSHFEEREVWTKISPADLKNNEMVTVGIFTEVLKDDFVDWIPTIYGVEIDEWATWTASLEVNLESYFKLDETSGTVVVDYMENNNGTNNGADVDRGGILGTGYTFDGSDNINMSSPLIPATEIFSISMWFNLTVGIPERTLVSQYTSGQTGRGYLLVYGGVVYWVQAGATNILGGSGLNDGNWHNVIFTSDGTNRDLYVDGVKVATDTDGVALQQTSTIIGVRGDLAQYWTGNIDEVGFWSRALDDDSCAVSGTCGGEIADLWNGGVGITPGGAADNPPIATLISPANESLKQSNPVSLNATATDDIKIDNVTLYINGVANQTDTSGVNGSYSWPISFNEGIHNWSIIAIDNSSQSTQSETWILNFSLPPDLVPEVILISPANESNLTSSNVTFIATATDDIKIDNVTLYIDGAANQTNTSGVNGSYTFVENFTDGIHIWSILAFDNNSQSNQSSNRTFTVHTVYPNTTIFSPSGLEGFFTVGNNETLSYNFSEVGEGPDHFVDCWYVYGPSISTDSFETDMDGWLMLGNLLADNRSEDWASDGTWSASFFTDDANLTKENIQANKITFDYNYSTGDGKFYVLANGVNIFNGTNNGGEAAFDVQLDINVSDNITFATTNSISSVEAYVDNIRYDYNRTLNCSENEKNFTYQYGYNNITIYGEDEFGLVASDISTWTYTLIEINQTFDATAIETKEKTFKINLEYDSASWSSVVGALIYDGVEYLATLSGSGDDIVLSRDIFIPEVGVDGNLNFSWQINLTNATATYNFTSSTQQQYVSRVNFFVCNYSSSPQIYFQTFSTTSPTTAINATFSSAWDISDAETGGTIVLSRSYQDLSETNSSWGFCIEPNDINYTISADITVDATNYTPTAHYIVDGEYSNATTNISLYLLADNQSTLTEIEVIDKDNVPIKNVYVTIQKYDIGTDTYYNVAQARTDNTGSDLAYLVWYTEWYKFIGVYNGEVIFTEGPKKISSTPQTFKYIPTSTPNYVYFDDIAYSLTFVNATDNFVLTYVDPSGVASSACLRVIKRNVTADYKVCETCETSSSATMYCNIGAWGNGTFIADFYVSGSPRDWIASLVELKNIQNAFYELIGNDNGTGLAILFAGIVLSLFLVSPAMGVLGAMLGMLGAMALGFQPYDYSAFIGITIVGGLIMWAVQK